MEQSRLECEFVDAVEEGNIDKIYDLIKAGVDPTLDSNSAFQFACFYNLRDLASHLLDVGVNVHEALSFACRYGTPDMICDIMKRDVDLTRKEYLALTIIAGRIDNTEYLLQIG